MGRRSLSAVTSQAPLLYILVLAPELATDVIAEQGAEDAANVQHGPPAQPNGGGHVSDDSNAGAE
ncbi:hypothetical protein FRC07_014178, partial [Ceratobasidium sp. 392]